MILRAVLDQSERVVIEEMLQPMLTEMLQTDEQKSFQGLMPRPIKLGKIKEEICRWGWEIYQELKNNKLERKGTRHTTIESNH